MNRAFEPHLTIEKNIYKQMSRAYLRAASDH